MTELHDKGLETAVLGALLIDNRIAPEIMTLLNPKVFVDPFHRDCFSAIQRLYSDHEPIDILTVVQMMDTLGTRKSNTAYDLTQITGKVASSANAEYHTRLLLQLYLKRESIKIFNEGSIDMSNPEKDSFDEIESVQIKLMNLIKTIESGTNLHISKYANEVLENATQAKLSDNHLQGIPSGFHHLDLLTNGWTEPDLIIIAGRPAMGKTAFMLNLAKNASDFGHGIGLFSLEMSGLQLTKRFVSMESGIETGKIDRGEFESIDYAIGKVRDHNIYINDKASISTLELRNSARKLVIEHGVKMIMVDYIQLMTHREKGQNREQEIGAISRTLKQIAKDLKVPVIALSQLSRAVEQRSDKRPMLSDLRESGAIEQDADKVLFLYRPEYYGVMEDEFGNSMQGVTEIIIAKHRSGGIGTVNLNFVSRLTKFVNADSGDFEEF